MSIHNEDIAAIFDELADLLEIEEANPFRVRAYRNAARSVRGLGHELGEMAAAGADLTAIPGIGKELAAKIQEILATGHAAALERLHQRVPASLEQLLKIPGLGPKRVKALYQSLHITSAEELAAAAEAGRLRELPGFGIKTEQHILQALAQGTESKRRVLRSVARQYAEPLIANLSSVQGVTRVVAAGSYRRGKETVGDLDILVTATPGEAVTKAFTGYEEVGQVISRGSTRSTVVLRSGLQVDLRVVPEESFGAALHYFTGSKAHNIQVRRLGQQHGLKINEYGVFRGTRRVGGGTEASVFEAVGLPFIAPELREGQGEIEAAQKRALPSLVELADLQGDLHVHTRATDGQAGLREMVEAARARGLRYIAITDHSQHLTVAKGLDPRRLRLQCEEIDRLNEELGDITVLKGIEVDILANGSLDLPLAALRELDLVIGAVHSQLQLAREKQTERILRAMDQPCFSILAHPSGRLLGEREPYAVDLERIIEGARERGCFLEINAQPKRLDLTEVYCRMAREAGVLVSIDSDAHRESDLAHLELGVTQARRGWLEPAQVLNTRPLGEVRRLLRGTMTG